MPVAAAPAQQAPSFILLLIAAFFYVTAAGVAFHAVVAGRKNDARHSRAFARHWKRDDRFWLIVAGLLLLGALYRIGNVEYMLQGHFRGELRQDNLYAQRRAIQAPIVMTGLVVGLAALALSDWQLRRRHLSVRLGAAAGIALLMFLCVRVVSAHGMDAAMHASVGGLKLSWIVEPGLLVAIIACATWFRQWRATLRRPSRTAE
ncbi:hypothetical protein [Flavisphingomonas formosensis]|uniref:hypothetical protein n=1 Tax=Flavisphingomonas formosensis TaxID=861534 RepID=UPI0012FB8F70|nr:hypothetical protein [Sphingomonas formosensis]